MCFILKYLCQTVNNTVKTTLDTEGSYFCWRHQDGYFSRSTFIKNISFYIYICKSHDHGMNSASLFSFHRPLYKHLFAFCISSWRNISSHCWCPTLQWLVWIVSMTGLAKLWLVKHTVALRRSRRMRKRKGLPWWENQPTDGRSGQNKGRDGCLCSGLPFPFPSATPWNTTKELLCCICLPHYEGQRPLNMSQNRSSLLWFSVSDILNCFMHMNFFLSAYIAVYLVHAWCLQRSDEGTGLPELDGCEPWYVRVLGIWVLCKNKCSHLPSHLLT